MKRNLLIWLALLFPAFSSPAQEYKKLSLENIFKENIFALNSVRSLKWMRDGSYYTSLVRNKKTNYQDILKYSTTTGEVTDTLLRGDKLIPKEAEEPITIRSYQFNKDESKLLIPTKVSRIYRRSTKAINYVYDFDSKELKLMVDGGKQSFATFSPDGLKVGFVRDNNLYVKDLQAGILTAVTTDGKKNEIINGFADWVYEEELSLAKAFFWSPDGSKIAYLKFNEKDVPVYNMQKWNGLYPEDYTFKYPKAGEKNSEVSVHIYDLNTQKSMTLAVGEDKDIYIARLQWLPGGSKLSIIRLNRLQNKLDILHGDAVTGETELIYTDRTDTYVDIDQVDDLTYLSDEKSFIISSERSGFKHLYHYSIDGKLINQITQGNWIVTDFEGINEKNGELFYTSTKVSSLERHIYRTNLKGNIHKKLSTTPGTHSASFSHDFKYYISSHSSISKPPTTSLNNSKGRVIKILADNEEYRQMSKSYGFAKTELFSIKIDSGDSLNAYMMKPVDFDASRKYPVLMYVYGGPGSQNVRNSWNGRNWHHFLTQQGYIIVCVDNRGTGGRGRAFQHVTYKQLGKYESEDQIASAKYIASLPFVDKSRMGIWGWSYGGYMSSLSLLLGNDVFKAAIAVAPVTNWRFYDTIYTERYLQKPQDNPTGYDEYSPMSHVEKLMASLLLIHGTGDDNVHFQNTVEFHNALIRANKQFDSFFYPNRNHGIYGGNTQLHLYTMMTNFILEKL